MFKTKHFLTIIVLIQLFTAIFLLAEELLAMNPSNRTPGGHFPAEFHQSWLRVGTFCIGTILAVYVMRLHKITLQSSDSIYIRIQYIGLILLGASGFFWLLRTYHTYSHLLFGGVSILLLLVTLKERNSDKSPLFMLLWGAAGFSTGIILLYPIYAYSLLLFGVSILASLYLSRKENQTKTYLLILLTSIIVTILSILILPYYATQGWCCLPGGGYNIGFPFTHLWGLAEEFPVGDSRGFLEAYQTRGLENVTWRLQEHNLFMNLLFWFNLLISFAKITQKITPQSDNNPKVVANTI